MYPCNRLFEWRERDILRVEFAVTCAHLGFISVQKILCLNVNNLSVGTEMLALICSFPAKMVLFREFINCLGIYQLVLSHSSDSAVSGLFGFISEAEDGHVKSECCSKFIGFPFPYVNCSVDLLLCLCVGLNIFCSEEMDCAWHTM